MSKEIFSSLRNQSVTIFRQFTSRKRIAFRQSLDRFHIVKTTSCREVNLVSPQTPKIRQSPGGSLTKRERLFDIPAFYK